MGFVNLIISYPSTHKQINLIVSGSLVISQTVRIAWEITNATNANLGFSLQLMVHANQDLKICRVQNIAAIATGKENVNSVSMDLSSKKVGNVFPEFNNLIIAKFNFTRKCAKFVNLALLLESDTTVNQV